MDTPLGSPLFRARGPATGSRFGAAIAVIGDINDDKVPDIAVGAPGITVGRQAEAGSIFVISGQDGTTLRTFSSEDLGPAHLGSALAAIDDVNADGHPELAVGAPDFSPPGHPNGGAVFTFSGRSGCPLVSVLSGSDGCAFLLLRSERDGSTLDARVEGTEGGMRLGASLANAGDLNGDGRPELIVGAPGRTVGGKPLAGSVFVRTTLPFASTLFRIDGGAAGDQLGTTLAGGGDVNGDGTPEILVGAPLADVEGRADAGYAQLYSGSDGAQILSLAGAAGSRMGGGVAFCGDVNGDGRAEIVLGAPGHEVPADPPFFPAIPGAGAAFVLSLPAP
jgi:hypothetical protein